MVNFLQVNLNRSWSAEQLMFQTAVDSEADVLLLSEPNYKHGRESTWCLSADGLAAIAVTQRTPLTHDGQGAGDGFAWMSFGDLTAFSCYWRPSTTLQEYEDFLGQLEGAIRARGNGKIILAGDFNAWSTEWGSRVNNPRGLLLTDLVSSLGLIQANTGSTPTFVRGTATSVIDVTFYHGLEVIGWQVLEADSLSDHAYVSFSATQEQPAPARQPPLREPLRGWSVKQRDAEALGQYFSTTHLEPAMGPVGTGKALASARALDEYLVGACEASMPRKRPGPPRKQPVLWWTAEIVELHRNCLALRRAYQSALKRAGQPGAQAARTDYSAAKRNLRHKIGEAKRKCWSELCSQVDADPWGKPYKIVMRKLGTRNPGAAARGREAEIADTLFPAAPATNWDEAPSVAVHNMFETFDPARDTLEITRTIPRFTREDLTKAVTRLSLGRASGPTGIPNEILKAFATTNPSSALRVYNDCLCALTFPPCWKRARLVLIRKGPDKPAESPSSYRPICMLDTPEKLLERLLLQRLESHLDSNGGRRRASNQYGFRRGVSTEIAVQKVLDIAASAAAGTGTKDLCVLVTLDVKNAFNSLRWPVIDEALRSKNTPEYLVEVLRSWLTDRELLTGEDLTPRRVTCGVPQGSVLGPTLWNVAYDSLLEMAVPNGVHLIGFADDLAVVGVARTGQQLEDAVNPTLEAIDGWMSSRGLELAHHKSEAVLLTKRRAFVPPRLVVGGHHIGLAKKLRYLGVILDQRLTFAPHVETIAERASRSQVSLARLIPNVRGPCQWKWRLLSSVVESQLLYAAPVWATQVSKIARTTANLIRPQRKAALRVIRAYRTVSDEAALLLAFMPPVDLVGLERRRIRERITAPAAPEAAPLSKTAIKREERRVTINQWQDRWAGSGKAAWTRKLIPDVRRWIGRTVPKIPLTFHMTQALTNHGCFQQYLHRMGRAASAACHHCDSQCDDANHTLFECTFWSGHRDELAARLGHRPSAADIPEILGGPEFAALPADPGEKAAALRTAEESFRLLYKMVEAVLTLKEEAERARQAAAA